jgi:hypothetical protein
MVASTLLLLQHPEVLPKLRLLAAELKADTDVRRAFVEKPATVVGRFFTAAERASDLSASWEQANKLILSIVSNEAFVKDLGESFGDMPHPTRELVIKEFARLAAKHNDAAITFNALRLEKEAFVAVEFVVAVFVAAVVAAAVVATVASPKQAVGLDPKETLAIGRQLIAHAKVMRKAGDLAT